MLRRFLDNVEKQILSNNKLKKFHPLYDALDTFLYSPNTQTQEAPYVRDAIDLKRTMIIVVLALLPSFLFGVALNPNIYLLPSFGKHLEKT